MGEAFRMIAVHQPQAYPIIMVLFLYSSSILPVALIELEAWKENSCLWQGSEQALLVCQVREFYPLYKWCLEQDYNFSFKIYFLKANQLEP